MEPPSMKMTQSHVLIFEKRIAKGDLSSEEVLNFGDCEKLYELLSRKIPQDKERILEHMSKFGMIEGREDHFNILKIWAILFARNLKDFESLARKKVIVCKYAGPREKPEQTGTASREMLGYF